MKLLYLVSSTDHPHDYGCDFLLDGFRELLGPHNVFDWPEKPCLHLAPGEPRDLCNIDSDAWWPSKGRIDPSDLARYCQLALVACQPDDLEGIARIRLFCHTLWPADKPLAVVDMTDHVRNLRPFYEEVTGRSLVGWYFKRELPLGKATEWGAHPCPLTYPAHRAPNPLPPKMPRLFYYATHHGGGKAGVPRLQILRDLRALLPATRLDVALFPSQNGRPSPEDYHARMSRALVGIHWNGAANWDANRWSESLAFGLCVVAETPRICYPYPFEHLRHCVFVKRSEEVASAVRMLLQQPTWALNMAAAAHEHFLTHHCARARAAYVLRMIQGERRWVLT